MITYGLCRRTTGYEKIQRNDLWLLSMFEDRHQNGYENVAWVIVKWMKKEGSWKLIPDIPVDDVQRFAAQRASRVQRALIQDLYERIGVYSVPLQGAYNPPGYAQPQYDEYYQQYYPQQLPQQQHDDEEDE
ncbi:hypothetical protein Tco_0820946 [Tanacetum coccineum]|uniref:Uncharacterized protein n=1 Tax=Tanacetum coccineum TaxID=301880 RepID=A0ABQ5ADI9_9ASTR